MHIEVLVEDSSGARLVSGLMHRLLGAIENSPTWRIHSFKGVGRLPHGLNIKTDPSKRLLLDQLPKRLAAYGKTSGIDAVLVVLDSDKRNCTIFYEELESLLNQCHPAPTTLFRLATEEIEAWLLGDQEAVLAAYPRAKKKVLAKYKQDSVCDTWELLADAVYPGGRAAIKSTGWPLSGQIKHEWVEKIEPHMDIKRNLSPSFCKFCEGIRHLAERGSTDAKFFISKSIK